MDYVVTKTAFTPCGQLFELVEFLARRQPFRIADHLDRKGADPVAARNGGRQIAALEQRAHDADGKSIAGAYRVDDARNGLRRDIAGLVRRAKVSTLRAKLDDDPARAQVEIKPCDLLRRVVAGEHDAFAQPRKDPVGERGERIERGDHRVARRPQRRAQIRIERDGLARGAHRCGQVEGEFARRGGDRRGYARQMQMARVAGVLRVEVLERQVACSRPFAEIFHDRVAAVGLLPFQLKPGGMARVDAYMTCVDAFARKRIQHIAPESVRADAAHVAHAKTEPRQTDRNVQIRTGNPFREMTDGLERPRFVRDEERHGLTVGQDVEWEGHR